MKGVFEAVRWCGCLHAYAKPCRLWRWLVLRTSVRLYSGKYFAMLCAILAVIVTAVAKCVDSIRTLC
jgi:hypothetical protein